MINLLYFSIMQFCYSILMYCVWSTQFIKVDSTYLLWLGTASFNSVGPTILQCFRPTYMIQVF